MKLPNFAVKRPVTIAMIVCMVLLLGGVSLSRLAIDLYPEINLPVAIVNTTYSGAGPQEVEEMVTKPLEEILGTVSNVDQLTSETAEGSSMVAVWFNWGTDLDFATLQMREKIDFIKPMMPDDVSDPMVMQMDPAMMPILQLGLSGGKDLIDLKRIAEDKVTARLERIEGVASVYLTGGKTREIKVAVDPVKLQQYGLSLGQITQTLRTENINMSAGRVVDGKREFFARTLGEYDQVSDIGNVVLQIPTGGSVRLSEVADILDGFQDMNQITRMNGGPSVGLVIMKESSVNTVAVATAVKEELKKLEGELDGDIEFHTVFDQSDFIEQAIGRVVNNTIIGGIFAVIILFFFLRNVRSTLVIALSIPISIISTFILIYFNNLTLNMMSMGGLALGVGMMVDSSIVILENIFRYRQEGRGMIEAATEGSNEVASAVVASTLTTVAVFLPIVFVEGIAAQLFKQLALTVSFALGASLLVSLTLIPMLSSKLLVITNGDHNGKRKSLLRRIISSFDAIVKWLTRYYTRLLGWALGHRKTIVAIVTFALIGSFALVPRIGMEFLPKMDAGEMSINIELAKGSMLQDTDEVVQKVEDIIYDTEGVENIFTTVGPAQDQMTGLGGTQKNKAQIRVLMTDKGQRAKSTEQIVEEVRKKLSTIAGAEIKIAAVDPYQQGMTASPISVKIKGDDLDVLKDLADEVIQIVDDVPGTREVESSFAKGSPELQLIIDRDKAARYGLNAATLASTVNTAMQGQVATRYKSNEDEIDVRVIYPKRSNTTLQDLESLTVPSPMGFNVPVSEVITIVSDTGPGTISREDQVRMATVNSQIVGRDLASVSKDIESQLVQLRTELPNGYEVALGGEQEEMMDAFGNLLLALLLAIVLVYMVMASQFESLVHPFVIMFSLPTTFIGVVLGLVITGRTFSVPTFIGVIMLAGIVVNNAIVLVDYINILQGRGQERNEAIMQAGPIRLRPILMTTFTTVLALIPTALGIGAGSESSAPMAVAVVFGLSASMMFTLVFVPVVYTIVDDFGGWTRAKIGRRRTVKTGKQSSI